MPLTESDTRAKLIDPALHVRGWTEDLIRREETAGTVEIIEGRARRQDNWWKWMAASGRREERRRSRGEFRSLHLPAQRCGLSSDRPEDGAAEVGQSYH